MHSISPIYVLALAGGGAAGAVLRFFISTQVDRATPSLFPWGTLTVNVIGSLLFGLVAVASAKYHWFNDGLRLMIATGGLGALTTFSTFSFETLKLLQDGRFMQGAANVVVSIIVCLSAVWIGMQMGNRL